MPEHQVTRHTVGFLSPGQHSEKLRLTGALLAMQARHDRPTKTHPADEPLEEQEAVPSAPCPCCLVGPMALERLLPRPTVQQIMRMSSDDLQQPKLPFW